MDRKPSETKNAGWIFARPPVNKARAATPNTGKWLIFDGNAEIDTKWEVVKKATEEGNLGIAAKVSTGPRTRQYPNYVICVYTYDWTDAIDVRRVREHLRTLGFTEKLHYKSDADTLAGKYVATGHKPEDIDKYFE